MKSTSALLKSQSSTNSHDNFSPAIIPIQKTSARNWTILIHGEYTVLQIWFFNSRVYFIVLFRRWSELRALLELRREALISAQGIQKYQLECDETKAWIKEKTRLVGSTEDLTNDLAGVMALQRKLSSMERDLAAIEVRMKSCLHMHWIRWKTFPLTCY